jgi:acetyl-CoA C-acetyltransferase
MAGGVVVAGGMESMTNAPYLLDRARSGYKAGDGTLADSILRDALTDPLGRYHMALTAERLAEERAISREEQDAFALASQQKAARAMRENAFDEEIVAVTLPAARRGAEPLVFRVDEFPRPETDARGLAALKPAFKEGGTVTAGNASGINDGAAVVVLASAEEVRARGLKPLGRILATASAGVEPERMGLGPVPAVRAALKAAGLSLSDIRVVELNEAFAAQSLAVIRELGLDPEIVNVNGGAIALGHPVGASGARILVTLLHVMKARGLKLGLATLCVGGGQGMAVILER